MIPTQHYIGHFNYMREENLDPQRELMRNYFRESINIHGWHTKYFYKEDRFFNSNVVQQAKANYLYGEDTTNLYQEPIDLIFYPDISADAKTFQKLGIESTGSILLYVLKEDFEEAVRKAKGEVATYIADNIPALETRAVNGKLTVRVPIEVDEDLWGYAEQVYDLDLMLPVVGISILELPFDAPFVYSKPKTKYIYLTESYTTGNTISGNITGTLQVPVNFMGNSVDTITGEPAPIQPTGFSGTITYMKRTDKNTGAHWKLAPQVGDFIRCQFSTNANNFNEYEFTKIVDEDLPSATMNPLLDVYMWKIVATRRDPSHERITAASGTSAMIPEDDSEEAKTQNRADASLRHEEDANKIFNYETTAVDKVDKVNVDEVYGGYDIDPVPTLSKPHNNEQTDIYGN